LKVLRTVAEASAWSDSLRSSGRRLAFVPTMGFLHAGHVSLMREGKVRADACAASIFVNPTQFGPTEDLGRYPRDFEGDCRKCEAAGVEAIFAPSVEEMYPPFAQTFVEVTEVSKGLCGEKRPGHFRGVATVVAKLFAIIRPHLALFGEKDYQQLQVLKALARDLCFGVEIVGMPTVREPDGLAMSSRNAYLSADERQRAQALSRGLKAAQLLVSRGEADAAALREAIRAELRAAQAREDYVEIVHAETLKPLPRVEPAAPARAMVAAFVGATRLIDNMPL
jgi:pantoate--beta-alanine ligase